MKWTVLLPAVGIGFLLLFAREDNLSPVALMLWSFMLVYQIFKWLNIFRGGVGHMQETAQLMFLIVALPVTAIIICHLIGVKL